MDAEAALGEGTSVLGEGTSVLGEGTSVLGEATSVPRILGAGAALHSIEGARAVSHLPKKSYNTLLRTNIPETRSPQADEWGATVVFATFDGLSAGPLIIAEYQSAVNCSA